MLALPGPLDEQFVEAVNLIEEEFHMTFVTSVERVLLRKERELGKIEGQQKRAVEILTTLIISKFGHVPDWAKARIMQADETTLTQWAVRVLDAKCVEDVLD